MGKTTGFMEYEREGAESRPVEERLKDWNEVYLDFPDDKLRVQGARCMDCGIPFCHKGCPLGNIIPDWNDLVYQGKWREAIDRLHATNNFPEVTGRVCPAPCETSCVLAINDDAVTIKLIELRIVEKAFAEGWIRPEPPKSRTGKRVAVVGSGPAGLACAQQLNRAGHLVTVFERADRVGGLLRYGIPNFKLEKHTLDRRLDVMEKEGIEFRVNVNVGVDFPVKKLTEDYHAVVLAGGSTQPRDLKAPGRGLKGVYFAMEYLTPANKLCEGVALDPKDVIDAGGKTVVILGGGDTGADCLGTAHRQGAKKIYQYELLPKPPENRANGNPWPQWPVVLRTSSAHEEGGERDYSILTKELVGENGALKKLRAVRVEFQAAENGRPKMVEVPGSEFEVACDLVFLAMGFTGPEKQGPVRELGLELIERGDTWRVKVDENKMTSVPGVFAAGDMERGQSLVVKAIADGRKTARGVDLYLMGETLLPENLADYVLE